MNNENVSLPLEEAWRADLIKPPKKSRRGLIIGIGLLVALFAVIGGVLIFSGQLGLFRGDQRSLADQHGCDEKNSEIWCSNCNSCKKAWDGCNCGSGGGGGNSGGGTKATCWCTGADQCNFGGVPGHLVDKGLCSGGLKCCEQGSGSGGGTTGGGQNDGTCKTGNQRCIGKAPGYYNLSQVAGVTDCYQCTSTCSLVAAPGKCGGVPAGGSVTPTSGTGGTKPGYECNPGVGLPYNGDIRCGAAGGCSDSTMGQVCGTDGKWVSGCVRAHACGYVSGSGECSANRLCKDLGYGQSYTCVEGKCVDTAHQNRYFTGCGQTNPCLNCYSDGTCVLENTSCGIKPECRGGTTAPTTTVTQVAQVTNQPTKNPTSTTTPKPSQTSTPTPTETVTPTETATPTPNSCNGTCTGDSDCQSGLVCSGGYCRNSACTSNSNCVCTTDTPAPTPNSCNGACTSDTNCQSGLVCSGGACRNSSCTSETSCTCPTTTQIAVITPTPTSVVTSTPAPATLPDTGLDLPTIAAFGGGILMVLVGMLFAI